MRPGRPSDLPALTALWADEVRRGSRDCAPTENLITRWLADFDWPSRSRMADGEPGRLEGAVLVTDRQTAGGIVARVELATAGAASPELQARLATWGLGLSRTAGAASAHVWTAHGQGSWLGDLEMTPVRPWWRMDRSLVGGVPVPAPVEGYALREGPSVSAAVWADVFNRSFEDHWRFSPRTAEELAAGQAEQVGLLAVAPDGSSAAMTRGLLETYRADPRPQPVGLVATVGTIPAHRRRGLANWLVAEALVQLEKAGATHASLYVDGLNQTRAADAYRKLGFEVAFESEVWEATFP